MDEKLKPCPVCGGEAIEKCSVVRCGNKTCPAGNWVYPTYWQSLPRPKPAPRCPECGNYVVEALWCEDGCVASCVACGWAEKPVHSIDAALDAWRPTE